MKKNKKKRVNFNFNKMKPYQLTNIIAIFLCLVLIGSLSVGYAVLSKELTVEGAISLKTEKDIKIINLTDFTSTAGAYEVYNASHNKESITINVALPQVTSTASYTISIMNNCDVDMELKSILEEAYSNRFITYDLTNIKVNDILAKGTTTTATITFRYQDDVATAPENKILGANIKFQFDQYTPEEYEFAYQPYYQKYAITKYTGTKTSLIIPSTYQNVDIMSIDKYAFQNKNLTIVMLPERLETIAFSSFQNNALSSLIFPATLKSIGNEAFYFNPLEIISFKGETPPTISPSAFDYNFKLKTVCIPATANHSEWKKALDKVLTAAPYEMIAGKTGACAQIGTGDVGETPKLECGPNAYQTGNVCSCHDDFEGDPYTGCTLIENLRCLKVSFQAWTKSYIITGYNCSNTDIIIPDSYEGIKLTKLNKDSFKSKKINSITIGNNVDTIDMYALKDNNLTSIVIPSSVKTIVNFALSDNKLKSVIFKGMTPPTIGTSTFQNNPDLTKICIPPGTTSAYQEKLADVKLPSGVQYYEDDSFCN